MKFRKAFCMIITAAILSGCGISNGFEFLNSDLVTPPFEDHASLRDAEIARLRGDVPQAINHYRDIIRDCIDCEKAYLGLGAALLDVNAVDEAKQTFEKAIALYPRSPDAYAGLGTVYLVIDQPENAMRSFDVALTLNPCLAKALNGYGIAFDMIGDHEAAQVNYRAALEKEPGNISYESNLGLSMALAGNTSEAIFLLERLSHSPRATPRVRQNLSLAYGLAGDMKMARAIGTVDLSTEWVQNNIKYIEAVRETQEFAGLIPQNGTTGPLNDTRKWQSTYR